MFKNFILSRAGKWFIYFSVLVCACLVFGVGRYFLGVLYGDKIGSENNQIINVAAMKFPDIAVAEDGKSVVDSQTKEVIFTINDAKNFLRDSGYRYNENTFQVSNAKYAGECFGEAALSNDRQKIVFSSSCLPGDMPQAWIGVYEITYTDCIDNKSLAAGITHTATACIGGEPSYTFRFLAGEGGRNFIWSADDAGVKYDADLGLTGFSMEKTVDINSTKITVTEDCENFQKKSFDSKDVCYRWVAEEKEDESVCGKIGSPEIGYQCYYEMAVLKKDADICKNLPEGGKGDCEEYLAIIINSVNSATEDWVYSEKANLGFGIEYPHNYALLDPGLDNVEGENLAGYITLTSVEFESFSQKMSASERSGDYGELINVDIKVSRGLENKKGILKEDLDKILLKENINKALQAGYAGKQGIVYSHEDVVEGIVQKADIDKGWLDYSVQFKSAQNGYNYQIDFHFPFNKDRKHSLEGEMLIRSDEDLANEFSKIFHSFKFIG